MYFIGDIHTKFMKYKRIIDKLTSSIQLGDMGLGFGKDDKFPIVEENYFIRGNHDNPFICQKQLSYLGEYGELGNYFFVSGGLSLDKSRRTPNVTWWAEEELNNTQFYQAFINYSKLKPELMFSHECPGVVLDLVLNSRGLTRRIGKKSATAKALDNMFSAFQPKTWIFAHHHKDLVFDYGGTHFVCCGECSVYDYENKKFLKI